MIREIIKIDEEKCNGCGNCIPGCPEGALQMIDGKARLVSDLMCDGLGACIGDCPEGAISIEKREAEPYDEIKVLKGMLDKGKNTVIAHLKHLKEHGETGFLKQAVGFLSQNQDLLDFDFNEVRNEVHGHGKNGQALKNVQAAHVHQHAGGACPGSQGMDFRGGAVEIEGPDVGEPSQQASELRQWPVQMHLINPGAPYFQQADVVLAADCVAFSLGDFHSKWLKGKSLAIACPKLDSQQESYLAKLVRMINVAQINTLTVMIMEVPCCGGLVQLARQAVEHAGRKVPLKLVQVGIKGDILKEEWL